MIKLSSPAKINLHLKITGKRPDGYHLLDTSFVYLSLHDEIQIRHSDILDVSCNRPHLNGRENLVHRLLKAFGQKHHVQQGLAIYTHKTIPEQAGLGGGSSNAATALMAANELWKIHASKEELIAFSASFGADVPCFLFGQASRAFGIGEQLEPLSECIEGDILLVKPSDRLSTQDVFRSFAEHLTDTSGMDTIRDQKISDLLGSNDLTATAQKLCPPITDILDGLDTLGIRAWMSGSGSTVVGLLPKKENPHILQWLKKTGHWWNITSIVKHHPFAREWEKHIGA